MEARGIATDKGSLNRLIRATNQKLREIARRIKKLLQGLAEIKEQLNAPQSPVLADLLTQRLEQRNAGAWPNKSKIGNIKEFSGAGADPAGSAGSSRWKTSTPTCRTSSKSPRP